MLGKKVFNKLDDKHISKINAWQCETFLQLNPFRLCHVTTDMVTLKWKFFFRETMAFEFFIEEKVLKLKMITEPDRNDIKQ